jgi:hypothetical protein
MGETVNRTHLRIAHKAIEMHQESLEMLQELLDDTQRVDDEKLSAEIESHSTALDLEICRAQRDQYANALGRIAARLGLTPAEWDETSIATVEHVLYVKLEEDRRSPGRKRFEKLRKSNENLIAALSTVMNLRAKGPEATLQEVNTLDDIQRQLDAAVRADAEAAEEEEAEGDLSLTPVPTTTHVGADAAAEKPAGAPLGEGVKVTKE